MTLPAPRIRWEDFPAGQAAGYVGTLNPAVFRIWEPENDDGEWMLTAAALPGAAGEQRYGSSPDELKAEAERWLEEFVSSLGAVFPEGECPECGFRPPTHTHDKNCSRYAPDTAATGEE